jgi:hypothetical protein
MTAEQAANLPVDHLALLLEDVAALKADAKHLSDLLHDALQMRYGKSAAAARRAEGKDTGRVRVEDGDYQVIVDVPKRVDWNQALLEEALDTLRSWGQDPADYVITEIRVPEARFAAWPPPIRALFEPARTVHAGRASFTLEPKENR